MSWVEIPPPPRLNLFDSARGLCRYVPLRKFGESAAIATTEYPVWDGGAAAYSWPTAAETLTITSADSNDDAAGTGARSVTMVGLDANWETKTETIALDGTTPPVTTSTWVRLHRAYVETCGTYGSSNAGNITITNTTSGDTLALIRAGLGQTQMALYTVDARQTLIVTRFNVTVDSSKTVTYRGYIRLNADDTSAPVSPVRRIFNANGLAAGHHSFYGEAYTALPGKTDVWLTGEAAANGTEGSGDFHGMLYPRLP